MEKEFELYCKELIPEANHEFCKIFFLKISYMRLVSDKIAVVEVKKKKSLLGCVSTERWVLETTIHIRLSNCEFR